MPLLSIETNQNFPDKQSVLLQTVSSSVAKLLGKPEQYVMVRLRHNPAMWFGGSNDPTAYIQLKSLGFPEQHTKAFSQTLCQLVKKELGIPTNRIYIEFCNPDRHMWGWNEGTF
jgi:phenylpyruvate tautomerase PptA (4-oxalocrotonate tautomerase family)